MRRMVAAALAALALAVPAAAQAPRINVLIDVTANDAIGRRLAYYVRSEVGRSGVLAETADKGVQAFKVSLVTMDPDDSGNMTIYSYSILLNDPEGFDRFITSYVGVCGSSRLESCAQKMVGGLGEQIEELRQVLRAAN